MGMVLKFSLKMPLETAIKQFSVLSHLKVKCAYSLTAHCVRSVDLKAATLTETL